MKKVLVPELRFPEFRDSGEWNEEELGDKTTKVGSGITPKGGDKNYKTSGRPFVRSQNVGWGHLILDDVAYIDEDTHATFLATEIVNNDVLLNITGASIGRSVVADISISGGNVNQHVCIIRTKPKMLNPFFLSHFILSNLGQSQIDSFQTGGNRQGLNFVQIRSFKIPVPFQTEEQQKIATCLSSIDGLITAQTQKLGTLKTHKKGLMQQLFPAEGETVPKLRFPEFQDAGEWESGSVNDISTLVMGNAFKSVDFVESGIQLIRMGNLYQGEINLNRAPIFLPHTFEKDYSKFLIKPLNLLMSMTGTMGKQDYGFIVQAPKDSKALLLNQRVVKITPKKGCVNQFLLQLFKTEGFLGRLYSLPGGTKQANLSAGQLKELDVKFPNTSEQQKVADCLSSIDDLITAKTQKIDTLKAHKKGLMQQLFPAMDDVIL